jgi:hypothetical protein
MIIYSNRRDEVTLELRAYSFQDAEFAQVERVFHHYEIEQQKSFIANDRARRRGVLYTIIGFAVIQRLENRVGVSFFGETATLKPVPGGSSFRCKRIQEDATIPPDCKNIEAENEDDAFLKCALRAREAGWFGGESERGTCRSSFLRL